MRGIIGSEEQKPNSRRWWPLVVFLVVCLTLGVWAAVSQATSPRHATTVAAAATNRPRRKKVRKDDGDQAQRLDAPSSWPKTARRTVLATLGWSKREGTDVPVSEDNLVRAGMSPNAANSYRSVWSKVFAPAVAAKLNADRSDVEVTNGPVTDQGIQYVVTVGMSPTWTDKRGRNVRVPSGRAQFTVTMDSDSGMVKSISEPDPQWMWFALPADGLKPSNKPKGE